MTKVNLSKAELVVLLKPAMDFLDEKLEGRANKHSYEVAAKVFFMGDLNLAIAGLLHDVVEDTDVSSEEIEEKFGKKVADFVKEVTKDENGDFHIKTRKGFMLKLADILHNLGSEGTPAEYAQKKLDWLGSLKAEDFWDNGSDTETD